MKASKIVLAIAFVAAIFLSGCKSKTCTLTVQNNYSLGAMVFFTQDSTCTGSEKAELTAIVPAGQTVSKDGVDVSNLYGQLWVATGDTTASGDVEYEYRTCINLKQYYGMRRVTIEVTSAGYYGINASDM